MIVILAAASSADRIITADWAQFRGPNATEISDSIDLPIEFNEESTAWCTEVPIGKSSPVVVGDHIYLTAPDGEQLLILTFARDSGERLWTHAVERRNHQDVH
jgi:hypothetical protein